MAMHSSTSILQTPQLSLHTRNAARQLCQRLVPHHLRVRQPVVTRAASQADEQQQQQREAERKVTLRKPVGVVFAQNKGGPVFVEDITPGSNADKSGAVQVGDVLSQCSAVVLKAGKEGQYEKEGYGQRPYDNWETVMFDCEKQDFKTVMAALKSNNERWGIMNVTLVFRRPQEGPEAGLCEKQAQPA